MSIIETWAYQMTQPYFFIIAALVFIGAMAMSYGDLIKSITLTESVINEESVFIILMCACVGGAWYIILTASLFSLILVGGYKFLLVDYFESVARRWSEFKIAVKG
jgi:hypothetical protein